MEYTQKEIRDAHKRIEADIKLGYENLRGITLAMECQEMILDHLTSIMTEEEIENEEISEEEESKE